jgi:CRISPR/Cas system CSM-associated protein Csm2 small subunit
MGAPIGPVIIFRIDTQQVASGTSEAMRQIRDQAKSTSQAVADDWKVKAAQIRAAVASSVVPEKDILAMRQQEASLLEKTISSLRTRSELSVKELSNLKAATLELERQSSILKGGSGLTAGTMSFANVISGFLSRTAAQIGAGAFGVSGGSQLASGALSGLFGGTAIAKITETAGPATLAVGALAAGLIVAGTALVSITHNMMEYAQEVQNVASATGLTTTQVQQFREVAKITGLDADGITNSFARLQAQLGKYVVDGKSSEAATENFVKVLDRFNVSVTDSGGKLRPINDIMSSFSAVLAGIPDQETRTAVGLDAMGIRGKILIQLMENARVSGMSLAEMLERVKKAGETDDQIKQLLKEKQSWDDMVVSIDAAETHLKGYIALHVKEIALSTLTGPTGFAGDRAANAVNSYLFDTTGGAPGGPAAPSFAAAQAQIEALAEKTNALLLKRQQIIAAGGEEEFRLGELRKQYAEALKDNHTSIAASLLQQINSLTAILKMEERRAQLFKEAGTHPGKVGESPQEKVDKLLEQLANPKQPIGEPNVQFPASGITNLLPALGSGSLPPDVLEKIKGVNDEWYNETVSASQKIKDEYEKNFEYFKTIQDMYPQYAAQISDVLVKLKQDETKHLEDLGDGLDKKIKELSGKLFDDLLSGHAKDAGKKLSEDLLKIFLEPIKKQFETQFTKLIEPLIGGSSTDTGAAGASTAPAGGGWKAVLGKIFGSGGGVFGSPNAPGGTPGYFPGSIGLGGGTGTGTAGPGQFGVATMNVTAGVVNISGTLGLPGTGPLASSTGNFFGNLNPFSSGSGDIPFSNTGSAGLGPYGGYGGGTAGVGTGASGIGGLFSSLGPFIGAGAMVGAGIASKSPTAIAMGMSGLAQGGIASIIKNNSSLGGTGTFGSGDLGLGTVSKALPGIGLYAAGVAQGGVGGTMEATLGGAEAGMAFGGPVGAAIGAGVGLISGVVSTLIQGPSFKSRVAHNMAYDAYRLPPSETFSFAEGSSIGQTLSTGAVQSGSTFSSFGLPANTPFWANPVIGRLDKNQQRNYLLEQMGLNNNQPFEGLPTVNPFTGQDPIAVNRNAQPATSVTFNVHAIDAKGVSEFLQQHGGMIAQHVANQVTNSSSAFASRVRMAAFPP